MPETVLHTKLFVPPLRPNLVARPQLIEHLDHSLRLSHKFTLISAPAGFGKTTLVSAWVQQMEINPRVAWLSLDDEDNDLARFLTYVVAALQTIESEVGQDLMAALQSPGNVNAEIVLTNLLNEISDISDDVILILDDYHVIESPQIDKAITFLLNHLPQKMRLIIASRIDPSLPLSRLRARGQMIDIRADDLRFTPEDAAAFLNQVMAFDLSDQEISALENHTEGWIAGLQLAALSMKTLKRRDDVAEFISKFTGSDRYIHDYLADEVLQERSQDTTDFLLQTSILNRLCGSLCDAVTAKKNSQVILENLEAANLFLVPLDNDRRWYRYHHLFADLLRQRLQQQPNKLVDALHIRASSWYERNNLEVEALTHAAAARDIERAMRLVQGNGMPLYFRGEAIPVLNWLESLPKDQLNSRPALWVMYAEVLQTAGRFANIEAVFQAAEAALQGVEQDAHTQDLMGTIASMRATMLIGQRQVEDVIAMARRALDLILPDNLAVRAAATWVLAYGYQMAGNREAASQAYSEAVTISQASNNGVVGLLATTGLGNMQAAENRLHEAMQTYQRALQLVGEQPLPLTAETYLGLARIFYEWNDLEAAQHHGQQSVHLAQQMETSDIPIAGELLLARVKLSQGDTAAASTIIDQAKQWIRRQQFIYRIPEVAAVQVLLLLRQGNLTAAANLAQAHDLPTSQIQVLLAQGEPTSALAKLYTLREKQEARDWKDEVLRIMVLQVVAHYAHGQSDIALELLGETLVLAEPGGFIRIFVDEGAPMARLLFDASVLGIMPDYIARLLAAFEAENRGDNTLPFQPLVEPLSQRELEVLQLVAQGLSNREISERLFLALDTVKGHNRRIFGKLGVNSRSQAVHKAVSLKIIRPQ